MESHLTRDSIVALGEIGYDVITKNEEDIFRKQLNLIDKNENIFELA